MECGIEITYPEQKDDKKEKLRKIVSFLFLKKNKYLTLYILVGGI